MEHGNCLYSKCGKRFVKVKFWQRFCSAKCKNKYWSERTRKALDALKESEKSE